MVIFVLFNFFIVIFVDLIQTDANGNKFEAGKVCFLVKGMLYLANQNSIVNKEVTTCGPYFCKNCDSDTFDYTKDWGMEFYGTEQDTSKGIPGSTIQMTNLSTITGAFRCPYTNFACMQKGKWTVKYIDEYGVNWSDKEGGQERGKDLTCGAPPIIGNALFKDVLQQDSSGNDLGMNEFGMYYTQCGQGGSGGYGIRPDEVDLEVVPEPAQLSAEAPSDSSDDTTSAGSRPRQNSEVTTG